MKREPVAPGAGRNLQRQAKALAKAIVTVAADPASTEIISQSFHAVPAGVRQRFVATAQDLVEADIPPVGGPTAHERIVAATFATFGLSSDEAIGKAMADLAEQTGSGRARHAAAVLGGRKGGRPPSNDVAAIARMRAAIAKGCTQAAAIAKECRDQKLTGKKAETAAHRFRKKLK